MVFDSSFLSKLPVGTSVTERGEGVYKDMIRVFLLSEVRFSGEEMSVVMFTDRVKEGT